jgi:D-alanyl-D-alanine carboxypeptidase
MKKTISTLTILLFAIITFSQTTFDKAKLDSYFDALEQNNKFMGSVAVSMNGEVIYTRACGWADVENKIKATEKSKYRIGSISKSFTAVLIMKAVELKKISLDIAIDKWFPSLPYAKSTTVRHLLQHRSGIHNFTNDDDYLNWNTQPKSEKEMIDLIAKAGNDFEPDSKAEYSNSNYVLLTFILEKEFSKSYAELLQEHIVKPTGLTNTYVFGPIKTRNNECKSYNYLGNWVEESETHYSIPLGAGAITSTPVDLTKFADALFGGKIISLESLETMKTLKDNFGLGLFTMPFNKSTGYGHTGGIDGFSSIYSHFADKKISYAMTCNGANMNTNDISIAVLSAAYEKPFEIPTFSKVSLTSEDLDKYLGVYSSDQMPLKITVTKEGNALIAQATGQSSFPLDATEKDKFSFEAAGIVMEFNPIDQTMILNQGGGRFTFKKD